MKRLAGFISAAALVFTVACAQTDAGITSSVKSKFAADDTVKAYQIDVDTRDHVVTLSGEVESMAHKSRAVEIARGTDGVTNVVDNLIVAATAATSGDLDVDVDVDADLKDDARQGAAVPSGRWSSGWRPRLRPWSTSRLSKRRTMPCRTAPSASPTWGATS